MSDCSLDTGNFTDGRLSQINNYNIQYYRFLNNALYRYSIMVTILIVLVILRNAYIIGEYLFGILTIPILSYWMIDMIYTYYSYRIRGPLNFDTIVWKFNKNSAPNLGTNQEIQSSSGSSVSSGQTPQPSTATCTGADCCLLPMSYDARNNVCVLNTPSP